MWAYAYTHGAPLPPPGSFQHALLSETIRRERNEKYSLVNIIARLLGTMASVDEEIIDDLLEMYREELYQLKYNYKYETARAKRFKKRLNEMREQAALMSRLDKMTVTDEDLEEERKVRDNAK